MFLGYIFVTREREGRCCGRAVISGGLPRCGAPRNDGLRLPRRDAPRNDGLRLPRPECLAMTD